MFATEFQGGNQGIEVLSPAGKNPPTRLLKINGSPGLITKDYERDIKGFKYTLSGRGSQSSSIQCPSVTKDTLALTQPLLVLQLKSAVQEDPLNLEVVVLDTGGQRRRFLFSTTFRSMDVNSLHAQIPWVQGCRDVWTNVVFNMQQLTLQCFSSKFGSIDSFLLRPCCSLRKIFTLPATLLLPPSVEGADDNGLIIPVSFDFPMGTISTTFIFSLKRSSSSSSRQVLAPSLPGSELLVSALQIRSRKSSSSAARKVDASPLRSGSATSRVKGAPLAACPEETAMMRSEMLVAAGTRALSAGSNRSIRVDVNALKSTALSNINTQKEKTLMPRNDKVSADDAQIDELSKLLTMGIKDPRSRIEDPRSPTMQPVPNTFSMTQQIQGSRPMSSSSKSSPTIAADLELELELKDEKNVYDFSNLVTDQRPSSSARQRDQRDQPIYRNFTDSRPGTASSGMSSMRITSRPSSARQSDQRTYQTGGVDDKPSLSSSTSLPPDPFGVAGSHADISYKMRERLVMGASQEEFPTHRSFAKNILQNQSVTHPATQPAVNQVHQSLVRPSTEALLVEDDEHDQEESSDLPVSVFSWGNRYYPKSAHDDRGIYGADTVDYNRNIGGLYGSVDNIVTDDVLRGSLTRASMTSIVSLSDNFDIEPAKTECREPSVIPARTPLSVHTDTDPEPQKAEKTPKDGVPSAVQPSSALRTFQEQEMRAMNLLSELTTGFDREANENLDTDTHRDIHSEAYTDKRADTHADTHKVTQSDTNTDRETGAIQSDTHTDRETGAIQFLAESETSLRLLPLRSISSASTAADPTHRDIDPAVADVDVTHTDLHIFKDAITDIKTATPDVETATPDIKTTTPDIKVAQSCIYDAVSPQLKPGVNNFSPELHPKVDTFSPLLHPRIDDSFSPILTTRRVEAPLSARSSGGKPLKGADETKAVKGTDDTVRDGVQGTGTGTEMGSGTGTGSNPKLAALSNQLHTVLTVLTRKERGFIEEFGERCFLAIR
jgi:Protein of unknown function (DUF667)